MKFKILIDKESIKENSQEGAIVETIKKLFNIYVEGKKEIAGDIFKIFNMFGKLEISTDGYVGHANNLSEGDAYIVQDVINRYKNTMEKIEINQRSIINFSPQAPQPRYSFEYLPTFVECNFCKGKFDFNYLRSSGGNYDFPEHDNVCPICVSDDCCEIEFQSIEEALEEMKI